VPALYAIHCPCVRPGPAKCTAPGLGALTKALAAADENEDLFWKAEIHRLKGELLLKQDHSNVAEAQSCFQRAVEIARNQSAKSLELRATTNLARLLAKQGRRDEARAMLAEIYDWFTEGWFTEVSTPPTSKTPRRYCTNKSIARSCAFWLAL